MLDQVLDHVNLVEIAGCMQWSVASLTTQLFPQHPTHSNNALKQHFKLQIPWLSY